MLDFVLNFLCVWSVFHILACRSTEYLIAYLINVFQSSIKPFSNYFYLIWGVFQGGFNVGSVNLCFSSEMSSQTCSRNQSDLFLAKTGSVDQAGIAWKLENNPFCSQFLLLFWCVIGDLSFPNSCLPLFASFLTVSFMNLGS